MSWEYRLPRRPRMGVAYTRPSVILMRVMPECMQDGPFVAQYGVFEVDPTRGLYVQYEGTWTGGKWVDAEGNEWAGERFLAVSVVNTSTNHELYIWHEPASFATTRLFPQAVTRR